MDAKSSIPKADNDSFNEASVIARCQAGDRAAFHLVYEKYSTVLFRTALLMTRNREQAEDALQDTFVAAWKKIGTYKPGTDLRSWLVTILLNNIRSWRRRIMRRAAKVNLLPLDSRNSEPSYTDEPSDPVEVERLMKALQHLGHQQRSVVVLRYYAEMTVPEIAKTLDCPEGTVKSQLHRAVTNLRKDMTAPRGGTMPEKPGKEVRTS